MDSRSPITFNGDSPLHVAVRQGQIEDVRKILIHQQVDVNILNSKHEAPLHLACSKRDSPIVQLLVAFGANPFIKDSGSGNAYNRSDYDVQLLINKLLFGHGLRLWIDGPVQPDKESPLHTAVRLGRLDDIQRIIEEEIVDINDTNANHETPLHLACALGHKHIVHILMSHGANIYKKDIFNNAPIHRAVSQGHIDTVDYLRTDYACNPKMKGYQGRTLLHFACGIGNVKLVNTLIEKYGISPMATDAVNQTPLHIAASHGQEVILSLLITNYKLIVDCRSNFNLSPLHLACYCGHESVVKILLLEYKADLNAHDESGGTPFQKVAMGGSSVLLQLMTTYFDLNPLSATDDYGNTALHVTCWYGYEDVSRLLITKYNCPANIENNIKDTPLHMACSSGHNSIIRMLVSEFKADATQRDHNNNTAVSKAAEGGHVETVKVLITELGCSPKVTGYDGRSLLHDACRSGSIKLAEMLIIDFSLDVLSADDSGNTPLHMACLSGHEELARLLITKYNCPVDVLNKNNHTPLHYACMVGHSPIVKMLVSEFKANLMARDHENDTPVNKAALNGHEDTVQMLIAELGCSPQVKGCEGRSLLHYSCEKGHTKLSMVLITEFDLNPLSVDDSGNTPLHMACLGDHEDLSRLLIAKYDCPVDIENKIKETPLHIACSSGHSSTVRMLVSEFKADATQRDHNNDTPVSKAARNGHVETIQSLLTELGCSPKVTGNDGRSLLHEACWSGSIKLAEMLISDFSLDVLSADDSGNTPLHLACLSGHEELARLLITKYNYPVDVLNKNNHTPLHYACMVGHSPIVKMLVSEFKANLMARDHENDTPVNKAALNGHEDTVHIETVKALLTKLGCSLKVTDYDKRSQAYRSALGALGEILTYFSSAILLSTVDTPLHIACLYGHEELARLLITKYNCPINFKDKNNWTPLHLACISGHSSIVRMLVSEFKADATQRDHNNNTAVSKAAEGGHVETVQALITELGCSPKVTGYKDRSLLHEACWSGSIKLAEMLIIDFSLDVLSADDSGNTPLHMACLGGHEELARLLITKYNCPVDAMNKENLTPLHLACSSGHLSVVRILISEFNADKYAHNNQSCTPLGVAVLNGHVSIVQVLINEFDCSPQVKELRGRSLLHYACGIGHTKLAMVLITDFRLDPLSVDDDGNTPLHMACLCGHEELARLLITKYNCPVNAMNKENLTPLHLACSSGHLSVVRILISEFNADKYAHNNQSSTPGPLGVAVLNGHVSIVQVLVNEFDCSPQVKEFRGRSLLHYACGKGHTKLAMVLITDFKLDPLSVDDDGNTPLHMACLCGHDELARLLITKYNCPIDVKNKNKQTSLHMACFCGHLDVSKVLISECILKGNKRFYNALDKDNNTPLNFSIKRGDAKAVHILSTEYGLKPHVRGVESKLLLHQLAAGGFTTMIKELISKFNHDPACSDEDGNTILHIAAQHGQFEIAEFLIINHSNQYPIDQRNSQGQTALHCACIGGHTRVAKFLIANKADITVRDKKGDTPFKKAFLTGHIMPTLFELFDSNLRKIDHRLLLQVCKRGSADLIDVLLSDFCLDPSSVLDNQGNKPLHIATLRGHKEVVTLLVKKYKCPVNVKNKAKKSPLHIACSRGYLDISKVLISVGNKRFYNALDKDNNTPLDLSIKRGDAKAVHILSTEYGLKPHVRGVESKPLLHQLAAGGSTTMIKELISNFNYDPVCPDEDGNTILHTAAEHGQYEITNLCITNYSHQCPIDHRNCRGLTALHYACMRGHVRIASKLIANKVLRDKELKDEEALVDDDGNTLLHIAAQHGQYEIAKLLFTCYSNRYPIDRRNSQGQTALHCACIGGHTGVAIFLFANKADITIRDEDGDTPFKKAFLTGHELTLFELFDSNLRRIDDKLLRQVCSRGSIDLIDVLLSDFHLDPTSVLDDKGNKAIHIAAIRGHKQVLELLIKKYKCPIDSRNANGQTPLHLLCSQSPTENGRALIRMCVSEFKADVTIKDNNDDQPIHAAVQAGYSSKMVLDHRVSPNSRGFKKRSLLHFALAKGHTSTAKTLIEDYHLSLHCVDEDGNTPLHLSSSFGQPESLRFLLYEYHAPVYVRNKAGKIALDLAMEDSTKKVIREYVKSEHNKIQYEYEELRAKSKQKYSGKQIITRVFVLGNPGSGKSTLVESLKRKGIFSSLFTVTEADVPPHTAGIIPSVHQSKEAGRLLYYDFAGDKEYYSSHAAILEIISDLTAGNNVYFIVADLRKDNVIIHNEIGYWLSFVAYHGKASDNQCRLKIIVILSHSDHLSSTDCVSKIKNVRQYLHAHKNQYDETFNIIEVVSSNCRSPRSTRSIESIFQQISKDTPPCSISYEASMLHGILENDFNHVVACKFQGLLSHVKDANICLPTIADLLFPIVKELHDIGLLTMIGRSGDSPEDYLLLLNLSSLTHEVHQNLFSKSAMMMFSSSIGPQYANMGILPESYLARLLPDHISKECLVQLQYCQEFTCADVGLDSSGVSNSASEKNLLYFPALCKLDSEQSNWPTDPLLNFSIGWYAKCTGKFDYFPARFLHVLLLRLAFTFALPIANCHITEFNEISAHNRRCTMWKNGIRWLMEEGVECIFETVNDNKGIIVITKSEEGSKEWANVLSKIVNKTLQAKAEFCSTISLYHFLLKSDNTSSFMNEDKLFEIAEIESVIKEGNKEVTSVSGRTFLDSSHLDIFRKYTFWGLYFPMNMFKILSYIKDVIQEWERLGMALQLPYEILRAIDADKAQIASKKEEIVVKWMESPGPACWWLLVKALKEIEQNIAADNICKEQVETIALQEKLIDGGDQKPDDGFLQSFAGVVGDHWPSLASLLSITAREIEEIKKEKTEQQALCMLTKWRSTEGATFKQLLQRLQTVYLFRC